MKPRDISYNHGCVPEKGAHLANYKLLDTLVTLLQQQVETRGRYLGQLAALVSPWSPAAHIALTHPPLTEYSVRSNGVVASLSFAWSLCLQSYGAQRVLYGVLRTLSLCTTSGRAEIK